MDQEYELVQGFETEKGLGLYDYEALANKPGVVSASAPGFAPQLDENTSSFLRGDGTWATPPDTTYNEATWEAAGLMSIEDKKKVDGMETAISDAIDAIDYPVDSVNGKIGEVVLDYNDVTTALGYVPSKVEEVEEAITNAINAIDYPVDSVNGKTGAVKITKEDIDLDKVENKSSESIRNELTAENVTTALGYTPPQVEEVEDWIKNASDKVLEEAQDAQNSANDAQTTADQAVNAAATADNKAVAAQNTANQAVGAAQQAQSTADDAVLAAQNAQNRADDAHERIDDSQIQMTKGEVVSIGNSADAPLQGLKIFGKTVQNGKDAPTPDKPVYLKSVTYAAIAEKNLVDVFTEEMNYTRQGIITQVNNYKNQVNEDGSITVNATTATYGIGFIRTLPAGKPVTISYEIASFGDKGGKAVGFYCYDVNNARALTSTTLYNEETGLCSYTITPNTNSRYFFGWLVKGSEAPSGAVIKNLQLEFGTEATEYEAGKVQYVKLSLPNGLPGIQVTSGGNYTDGNGKQWVCDEVDFEKGIYVQRVATVVFDGDESFSTFAHTSTSAPLGLQTPLSEPPALNLREYSLCNIASFVDNLLDNYKHGTFGITPQGVLRFGIEGVTSANDAKSFFKEHPATFVYALAEEKPIPLSEIDPQVLSQYTALHTNYPNTTIYNDAGAGMEVKYATPTSVLPIAGGAVSRLEIPTPTKPNDAVPKSYADRIDKKVDTLREVVSSFHSNIVQEASGEIIQVHGSAEAPLTGLKVFGKTEQFTTTGKNLYNINDKKESYKCVVDENNIITCDLDNTAGTSTAYGKFYLNTTNLLDFSTTYAIVTEIYEISDAILYSNHSSTANNISQFATQVYYSNTTSPGTYVKNATTRDSSDNCNVMCRTNISVAPGAHGKVRFRISVLKDTSITDKNFVYEPYTGGIPSPNPDYPQALEGVGDVNVTVCSKNLLTLPYHRQELSGNSWESKGGVAFTVNDDGSITFSGKNTGESTTDAEYVLTTNNTIWLPVGTYTISTGVESFTENSWLLGVGMYTGRIKNVNNIKYVRGGSWKFSVVEAGFVYLVLQVYPNVSVSTTIYPQLEIGKVATAYEKPASRQILPISMPNSLPGIPVTSDGNYKDENGRQWICDEIDFEKGQYIQRVKPLSVDGTIGRISSPDVPYMWLIELTDGKKEASAQCEAICSHCVYSPVNKNPDMPDNSFRMGTSSTSEITYLYFKNTQMTSTSDWKDYLGKKKMTVLYQLATPIYHKLSEIDPQVLSQYAALHTNYPNTTVYNNAGAEMEVKYVADTKMYVDKKFEELAEILVNKL